MLMLLAALLEMYDGKGPIQVAKSQDMSSPATSILTNPFYM